MKLFVDTSALLAVLDADDLRHAEARQAWHRWMDDGTTFLTSNYVAVEATALVQRRLGMEAVSVLLGEIVPVVQVLWVDSELHHAGTVALLAAWRRDLSVVDCVSFEIMRQRGLQSAFAFDRHFAEQGFTCLP